MSNTSVSIKKNLIFDVGMHLGEDTEYYMKRGFNVVAFEANPKLVQENKKKFSEEITNGRLFIVEGAIVDDLSEKTVKFFVNEDSSVWGTVYQDFAERNEQLGTRNTVMEVDVIDFKSCLIEFGIPYFMKIDIEGADLFCLEALKDFAVKPPYISMESNKLKFSTLLHEIEILGSLGYSVFKAVQQADVPKMRVPANSSEGKSVEHHFSKEASGLFGSDLPGQWLTKEEVIQEYKNIFTQYRLVGDDTFWQKNRIAQKILKALSRITGKHYPGWYDTHARHKSVNELGHTD
jgi:FkbM family methyltransferase